MNDLLSKKLSAITWEKRVERPGFFQPKMIHIEAQEAPIHITPSIKIFYKNLIWLNNSVYYDDTINKKNWRLFTKAFKENPRWPVHQVGIIKRVALRAKKILQELECDWPHINTSKKIICFKKYHQILIDIQKFYAFAVPLTNFCEDALQKSHPELLNQVHSYAPLDIENFHRELTTLAEQQKNTKTLDKKILAQHIARFAWIKTVYNEYGTYTEVDARALIKETRTPPVLHSRIKSNNDYFVGLQVGIFLRNRVKELCQQIWYSFDSLGRALAYDLKLLPKEFYFLTPNEIVESLKNQKLVVSKHEVRRRQSGIMFGLLNGKKFILSGSGVEKYRPCFEELPLGQDYIEGTVACHGSAQGFVRIIRSQKDFSQFKSGEVLVTSMTTPDFVVIMKKATAIVTDEGGLSCHAAIVSREMGKPCIIGTKIATKILHDGDFVEVDGEQGMVRKI